MVKNDANSKEQNKYIQRNTRAFTAQKLEFSIKHFFTFWAVLYFLLFSLTHLLQYDHHECDKFFHTF